jgi:polyhydroxyalkanoate synthesis regulator phasin
MASGREQYLQALASLSDLTRAQAERVAGLLAKQGEVQSAQVSRVAEDLMRRTQKNREIMTRLVQREVKRQLGMLGMATRDEVARLHQRVHALEQELERAGKAPAPTTGSPRASKAASSKASKAEAASGSAAKATRTRGGGTSSPSTASSPGTRRARSTKPKAGGGDGQP